MPSCETHTIYQSQASTHLYRRFRCVDDEHRRRGRNSSLEIRVRGRDRNAETHADCQSQCVNYIGTYLPVPPLLVSTGVRGEGSVESLPGLVSEWTPRKEWMLP